MKENSFSRALLLKNHCYGNIDHYGRNNNLQSQIVLDEIDSCNPVNLV